MGDTFNARSAHKQFKPPTLTRNAANAGISGLYASIVHQKSNADLNRAAEEIIESHKKLTELRKPLLAHGAIEEIDSTLIGSSLTSQADPLCELVEKLARVDVEYKKAVEHDSILRNKPDAISGQMERVGRLLLQQEVIFSSAEPDLVQQIKMMEQKLADESNLVTELKASKQSCDVEMDRIIHEGVTTNQRYEEAILRLEQKVQRRNSQIERLKKENDSKDRKLKVELTEIARLEQRDSDNVTDLEKQMLGLRKSHNRLQDDFDGLTCKYEASALIEKGLRADLQGTESDREDWQRKYNAVKAELKSLKREERNAVEEARTMRDNMGKQLKLVEQRIVDEQAWATKNCDAEWLTHLHEACGTSTDTSCWMIEKLWNTIPNTSIRSVPFDIRRVRLEVSTIFTYKPQRCNKNLNATIKKRALKVLLCLTHGDVPRLWDCLHRIYEFWYIWEDSSLLDDTRIMLFPLLWGIVFKAITMRNLQDIRGVILWLMLQLGCSLLRYSNDSCQFEELLAKVHSLQESSDTLLRAAALRFNTINKYLMMGDGISVLEDPSLSSYCQSLDTGADEAVTIIARELGKAEAVAICILTYRGLDFHVEIDDKGDPFFWHGESNGVAFFLGFDLVPWFALVDDERCWEIVEGGGHALRVWASRYGLWLNKCPEKFVELLQNRMNID